MVTGGTTMHIWKSVLVFVCLLGLIIFNVCLVVRCVNAHRNSNATPRQYVLTAISVLISLCLLVVFGKYVYPFERPVEAKLVAVLDIPEEFSLRSPGSEYWHAAYEEYGLYAGSFHFDPSETSSPLGFEWPEMDLENYTYIITYGQEVESLSYNVWETIEIPIRTGAYVGHIHFKEHFEPNEVYVYQIPKMRIDNDV